MGKKNTYFLITSIKSKYMYRVFKGSFNFELIASCSSSLKRYAKPFFS